MFQVASVVGLVTAPVTFGMMTHAVGFASAAHAMLSTAAGSAVAAGVERAFTGKSFSSAFVRDFGISSLNLFVGAAFGGGIVGAGKNGALQGYVRVKRPFSELGGGFTVGSSTIFGNSWQRDQLLTRAGKLVAEVGQHELGHTLQFIGLSAIPSSLSLGPWLPYTGLGVLGMTPLGAPWEDLANLLGKLF